MFMTFFIAGRKNWSKKEKNNPYLECLGVQLLGLRDEISLVFWQRY